PRARPPLLEKPRRRAAGPPTASGVPAGRSALLAALLEELGHQRRPARLVARADPGAVVPVEVLVEEDQVPPVRIALELLGPAVDRPPPVGPSQEQPREA